MYMYVRILVMLLCVCMYISYVAMCIYVHILFLLLAYVSTCMSVYSPFHVLGVKQRSVYSARGSRRGFGMSCIK